MILNGLLWKRTEIVLSFLRLYPSTAFWTLFVEYKGYSISSKEFLPAVVAIMVISVKFTYSGGSDVKASAHNMGDLGSIPVSGRSPGEGNGNPLQYSCLESPMDERTS